MSVSIDESVALIRWVEIFILIFIVEHIWSSHLVSACKVNEINYLGVLIAYRNCSVCSVIGPVICNVRSACWFRKHHVMLYGEYLQLLNRIYLFICTYVDSYIKIFISMKDWFDSAYDHIFVRRLGWDSLLKNLDPILPTRCLYGNYCMHSICVFLSLRWGCWFECYLLSQSVRRIDW